MAEVIPSFFNKADFWAMLLPGYVTLVLGIVLFFTNFLFSNTANSALPFNILVIILFIVAGPAVGFILWQIYLHMTSLSKFDRHTFNIKYEFQRAYAQLRLVCSKEEREELDSIDGRHIFASSTAIGLGLVSLFTFGILLTSYGCNTYGLFTRSIVCSGVVGRYIFLVLVAVVLVLALGSYFDNKRSRLVIICKLIEDFKKNGRLEIDLPSTCKKRFRKIEQRERKVICSIISYYIKEVQEKKKQQTGDLDREEIETRVVGSDLFHGDKNDAKKMIDELIKFGILDSRGGIDRKKLKDMEPPQLPHIFFRLRLTRRWPFIGLK